MFNYFTKFKFLFILLFYTYLFFIYAKILGGDKQTIIQKTINYLKKSYFAGPFVFNENKNKYAFENFENETLIKSNNEKIMKFNNISRFSRYFKIR